MTQTRRLLLAILLIAFSGGCWLVANAQQPTVAVRDGKTIHDALKRNALTGKSTLELKSDKQQPSNEKAKSYVPVAAFRSGALTWPTATILSASHAASGSGVVSPGCAATITGGRFAAEGNQANWPLPTTLGGVTVEVGGIEAPMYYVGPEKVSIIVPDVPRKIGLPWRQVWADAVQTKNDWTFSTFSIRELLEMGRATEGLSLSQRSLIRWYPLRVTSLYGTYSGWIAVAPTAPGFYQQPDGEILTPQGVYVAGGSAPRLITAEPIENNNTVLLLNGTGFLRAQSVQVFISDETDGYWTVPAVAGRNGLFAWMELVSVRIPPNAHGQLTITAQADAMTSNSITLLVQ